MFEVDNWARGWIEASGDASRLLHVLELAEGRSEERSDRQGRLPFLEDHVVRDRGGVRQEDLVAAALGLCVVSRQPDR